MRLVLIAGLPGAGKTTVAKAFGEMGTPVISMGDAMREEARRLGRPDNISSMREFMVSLRRERGEAVVAQLVLRKLRNIDATAVVIDGLRSEEELDAFRNYAKEVILVLVEAGLEKRFQRLSIRGRPDDPKGVDELKTRDETELTVGLERLLSKRGVRIVNDGDLSSLRRKVRALTQELGLSL